MMFFSHGLLKHEAAMGPGWDYAKSALLLVAVSFPVIAFVLVILLSQCLKDTNSKTYEIVGGSVAVLIMWILLLAFYMSRIFVRKKMNTLRKH